VVPIDLCGDVVEIKKIQDDAVRIALSGAG